MYSPHLPRVATLRVIRAHGGARGALARGLCAFPTDPADHSTPPFVLSSAGVPDQRAEPTFATRPPADVAAGDLVENPILPRRQVALRCQPGQQGLESTAGQQVNETARYGPRSCRCPNTV